MKSLIVYDSAFGNTKLIAEKIAVIIDAKIVQARVFKKSDLEGIELLIVGSPIRGWRPSDNTAAFLDSLNEKDLDGIKATSFDTRVKLFIHGDAMGKMANSLRSAGAEIFVEPMPFYVAGPQQSPHLLDDELEKAIEWARAIKAKV
ncbi:TPA: flavodoxin [Candidatus Berkelbacteria bacterium]|uniref:Flavodoxin-like domain-containing protein n=1 Tax=Berkelbacteria bacterium GW2011_GWE1_39_12 TaxID=1618337 RepID=A0A0G4B2V2_9BACT|nr:MAG: hypothetical protein UT28_C0001G0086 [Berkelbacteria bacterium GW2011_GWE1_39_12]HBO60478.1 flavodoxin [Candidatus Berkelbacteria bacterium]